MLEAKPAGTFSRDFSIEAEGQRVALLDIAYWGEDDALSIEGHHYMLYREGLIRGDFVLESDGRAVARAQKPSVFFSSFDLEFGDRHYSLRRNSIFGRSFSIFQGSDMVVGSIRPAGVFSRRALLDLPADWPVPVKAFIFWLVLVIWNRDESGAVGA